MGQFNDPSPINIVPQPVLDADGIHLWRIWPSSRSLNYVFIRRILGQYRHCDPTALEIQRTNQGKPYTEGGPFFNLSHAGDLAMVAVASFEVGLDIERMERAAQIDSIARRFFYSEEQQMLSLADEKTRRLTFVRLWVCKEAMVKLTGEGIFGGIRRCRVFLENPAGPYGEYDGRRVWLHLFSPGAGYQGAVASWRNFRVNCFFRT